MNKLFVTLILSTVSVYAQSGECYNPNTGENCGQCYVTGKTCEPANGRCAPGATCEWCQKIVRTEFCGIFLLAPSCWCFGLASNVCTDADINSKKVIQRQKDRNFLELFGKRRNNHGLTLGYLGSNLRKRAS